MNYDKIINLLFNIFSFLLSVTKTFAAGKYMLELARRVVEL